MINNLVSMRLAQMNDSDYIIVGMKDEDTSLWSAGIFMLTSDSNLGEPIFMMDTYIYSSRYLALIEVNRLLNESKDVIRIMSN